jgi:hypothetical protein
MGKAATAPCSVFVVTNRELFMGGISIPGVD